MLIFGLNKHQKYIQRYWDTNYKKMKKNEKFLSAQLLGGPSSEVQSILIKFQRIVAGNKHGRHQEAREAEELGLKSQI